MRCTQCGNLEDKVVDSRSGKDGTSIRRRRECLTCGHRFTTWEQIERNDLQVVKRNGAREPFDRDKLMKGLSRACEKRPVSIETIEQAAEDIINTLQNENGREVSSARIGPLVMERLETIDHVAYVRYASVYRQFKDVGEFINEIESLERRPIKNVLQRELFP